MKNHSLGLLILGALSFELSAIAQISAPESRPIHHFQFGYRAAFNVTADFQNLGGFASGSPGPATGGGIDRIYTDGYNRVDSSGNVGGKTWFWGYNSASQLPGDDTVVMHGTTSAPTVSSLDRDGDPHHGMELTYNLEVHELWHGYWGIEAAFNFTDLTISDNRTLATTATTVSDAFALGGIIPPVAPYAGTFSGPGPLIGDAPTRSSTTGPAFVAGQRGVNADIYGFRLGPYWELPLSDKWAVSLSGGLVVADIESQFSYTETVSTAAGSSFATGSNNASKILFGGYASANLSYSITRCFGLFAGIQYQNVGNFSQQAGVKTATVDLGQSVFVTGGLRFSF
jgi:hypothetical protein